MLDKYIVTTNLHYWAVFSIPFENTKLNMHTYSNNSLIWYVLCFPWLFFISAFNSLLFEMVKYQVTYKHNLLWLNCIFQTAAEYNRRGEKFFKELDFVIADVVWLLLNQECNDFFFFQYDFVSLEFRGLFASGVNWMGFRVLWLVLLKKNSWKIIMHFSSFASFLYLDLKEFPSLAILEQTWAAAGY